MDAEGGAVLLSLSDESNSLVHCWVALQFETSGFSFSSQYLSTEQEERQQPQTGQKDSADFNSFLQCAKLLLSSLRLNMPGAEGDSAVDEVVTVNRNAE